MYLWELSLGRTYTFKKFSQNFHTRAGVFTVQLYINIYLYLLIYYFKLVTLTKETNVYR